jgi:hypothetical protein
VLVITAVVTAANRITLFLVDPSGDFYMTSGNVEDGWRPWTRVWGKKTTPGAPVTAMFTVPNRVTLFMADREGGILHDVQALRQRRVVIIIERPNEPDAHSRLQRRSVPGLDRRRSVPPLGGASHAARS